VQIRFSTAWLTVVVESVVSAGLRVDPAPPGTAPSATPRSLTMNSAAGAKNNNIWLKLTRDLVRPLQDLSR
jgi:hypothetical protein